MKVLFLVSNYPHQHNPVSGNFYKIICEELVKQGVEVNVICPVPYIPFWLGFIFKRLNVYRFYPEYENKNGVKIYRPKYIRLPFGNPKTKYAHANRRVLNLFKRIRPDVIDVRYYYPALPYGWFALNIQRLFGIPFIYTNNGIDKHISENDNESKVSFYGELLNSANSVFAVSNEIINELYKFYKIKPMLIRHGIQLSNYKSFSIQKDCTIKTELKVIYAGAISSLKGIDTLISAMELLNDDTIHYTFVGHNYIGKNIVDITNNKNATYLGRLTHEQTINEISKSDLLILPTKFEGMPNVLKEAGILNIPVIASNVGGIPEFLNNGERGEIFEAGNEKELALKIEKVKNNYLNAQHKSNLLKEYIIEEYDIEKNTRDLINTYKNILIK